jgi:hypothetical protein
MQPSPCPEIFRLSRLSAVAALLREPSALFRLIGQGVGLARTFLLSYGHVEGQSWARIERQGGRFASVTEVLVRLPTGWFAALWAIAAGGGAIAIVLLLGGRGGPLASLVLLANAACASTFFASLLGDGLIDFARHIHLAQNAWIVACGATIAMLIQRLARALRPRGIRQPSMAHGRRGP